MASQLQIARGKKMSGQIFISYRREESRWSARSLYSRLCRDFDPKQIFMDIDAIALGQDFVEAIETTVAKCNVLIAVVGNNWLTSEDDQGNRRLDSPEDFVRTEIGAALKRKIRVIPVLVNGALMPRATDLPDDLKLLVRRNALLITETSFDSDCQRLAAAIRRVLEKAAAEEQERLATERRQREEKERLEAEQREKARLEAEQREKERLADEQRHREGQKRLEAERLELERSQRREAEWRQGEEKERVDAERRKQAIEHGPDTEYPSRENVTARTRHRFGLVMAEYTKTLLVLAAGAALVLAVVVAIGFFGSSTKPKSSESSKPHFVPISPTSSLKVGEIVWQVKKGLVRPDLTDLDNFERVGSVLAIENRQDASGKPVLYKLGISFGTTITYLYDSDLSSGNYFLFGW